MNAADAANPLRRAGTQSQLNAADAANPLRRARTQSQLNAADAANDDRRARTWALLQHDSPDPAAEDVEPASRRLRILPPQPDTDESSTEGLRDATDAAAAPEVHPEGISGAAPAPEAAGASADDAAGTAFDDAWFAMPWMPGSRAEGAP